MSRRYNDDDEDLDPDESESESDESEELEPARKKRKKSRKPRTDTSYFFQDEVSEASEEESDDYEGEEPGYREAARQIYAPKRGKAMADMNEEELVQAAKRFDRYEEGDDFGEDFEGYEDSTSTISRGKNLPTLRDPRLFMIRCKEGYERQAVFQLLQACFNRELQGRPLAIRSAICNDNVRGYIHIEARSADQVRDAIKGIHCIIHSKLEPAKLKDMPDVLKVPEKNVSLEKGNWVRVKRGVYKGDLAEVHRIDGKKIWVKLIPRLDLSSIQDETGKRKRKAQRPPQKPFDPELIRTLNREPPQPIRDPTGESFDVFERDRFKDGLLYKPMTLKGLDTVNIVPTLEEVKRFQDLQSDEFGSDRQIALVGSVLHKNRAKRQTTFSKGDRVRVLTPELTEVTGIVECVKENVVHVIPELAEYRDNTLQFQPSELAKYFKEGDHIKVISGRYKGDTGLVIREENDVVSVFSDLTNQEYQVLIHDIQTCSNITQGKVQLEGYQLHDLVCIGQQSVGVIVKVERESFQVLETTGAVKTVRVPEIAGKRRSGLSYDRNQVQISAEEVVKILEGKYKGKQGTVKYVYRHHVFVHTRDVLENSGIIVVRASSCVVMGSRAVSGRVPGADARGGFRGGFRGGRGGRFNKRPGDKINTTIKITKGPWKGYLATIIDSTENTYRVDLLSKRKVINVLKEDTRDVNETSSISTSYDTSMGIDRTPMRGDRTPMHGDRTPMRGDRTPMHGDRTPMHGDASPDEYYDREFSKTVETPSMYTTPFSPYGTLGTPQDNLPPTPGYSIDTPGFSYGMATPKAYPATPATPLGNPQTPGIDGFDHYDEIYQKTAPEIHLSEGIEVVVTENAQYKNEPGILEDFGDHCKVKLYSGPTITIPASYLEPTMPAKKDIIKICGNDHHNDIGELIGIDSTSGIVKLQGSGDIIIVDMKSLGKYVVS